MTQTMVPLPASTASGVEGVWVAGVGSVGTSLTQEPFFSMLGTGGEVRVGDTERADASALPLSARERWRQRVAEATAREKMMTALYGYAPPGEDVTEFATAMTEGRFEIVDD